MQRKDGGLVYESDLNDFDLREGDLTADASPFIKQVEQPIGIYRVNYKNGLPVDSYIEELP